MAGGRDEGAARAQAGGGGVRATAPGGWCAMTLLRPTEAELLERRQRQLDDLGARAAGWHARERRFARRMAASGAAVLLAALWLFSFGGHCGWQACLLAPLAGGALAWVIARCAFGVLVGMVVFGLGAFAAWLLCFWCGWWAASDGGPGGIGAMAGVIMMVAMWMSWVVAGAVLGMLSRQFDDDHVQV